jgi:predicted metal-dependent peptidase
MGRIYKGNKKAAILSESEINFQTGKALVYNNPLFSGLFSHVLISHDSDSSYIPSAGLAVVTDDGNIYCDAKKRAEPEVWARVIAHCLLHLAFGHFDEFKKEGMHAWRQQKFDDEVEDFLNSISFGKPAGYIGRGTAGNSMPDMLMVEHDSFYHLFGRSDWSAIFAGGISSSLHAAVCAASGLEIENGNGGTGIATTDAERIRRWFISSYPLLGSIASSFKLIEDPYVCQRMCVQMAAISCASSEIYVNPAAGLSRHELKFVMAHEFLHAALRHDIRHQWRDTFLWNVSCDYVINLWLCEMRIGEMPYGVLYDKELEGLSAEQVYDKISCDLRIRRKIEKLATLAGRGRPDILPSDSGYWNSEKGVELDEFYRRALWQGLEYHKDNNRGFLPAGLVEEIRALSHPPIPWDVELAIWFEQHFIPLEKHRTYARLSRRQSATPEIPRPNLTIREEDLDGRTFGVLLDTSGSMDRNLLATALGAIASYSASRDVPAARVVFCDADAYDQGYMKPDDIAGTVQVRGRGGTQLQPGIDLLDNMDDFPDNAPLLIITDGYCESRLMLYGREHAYLIPEGHSLPFPPKGKVFRIQ